MTELTASIPVEQHAQFTRAMCILADLLQAAKAHQQDGQLSATFRGRGVAQNAFAGEFLRRAQEDPAVFAAFVRGLSGLLAAWASGEQLTAEDLRQTTWEDVQGGPDTTYWGEVVPSTQPKEPPTTSGGASAPLPHEPVESSEASAVGDVNFMTGKALFCEMGRLIQDRKTRCFFGKDDRPQGAQQDLSPALEALAQIHHSPELKTGFCAALTGLLAWNYEPVNPYTMDEIEAMPAEDFAVGTGANLARSDVQPPPKTTAQLPAADRTTEGANWRLMVAEKLGQVQNIMGSAVHLDLDSPKNGGFARALLYSAQNIIDANAHLLRAGGADDYYGSCIVHVQAMVVGAHAMKETVPSLPVILSVAIDLLEQISRILDDAGLQDRVQLAGPLDISDEEIDAFMSGKSLCADMVAEAIRIDDSGSDEAELQAYYRGRGVPQNNFARRFLTQVLERPELLEGFSAALSCTMRCAGTANDDPDSMRDLTFQEYVGGDDSKYITEEEDASQEDIAAAPTAPAFVDPIEANTDTILQRLDTYLEGLEHVGLSSPEYKCLHSEANPHFWAAREALDQHMPMSTVIHRLRQLREGLVKVAEVMGEGSVGYPLIEACLKPLNTLFRPSVDDVEFTPARLETLSHAGSFISRMAAYFRTGVVNPRQVDWNAIHEGASVVMSFQDPMEDDASLEQRLNIAVGSASVIFEEQPPAHLREDGIVRQEDVGKRLVSSDSWELVGA
jgi:hypothetical protein